MNFIVCQGFREIVYLLFMIQLDSNIEFLKGVGPAKAEALKSELGIFTVADLLSHYPFRHEDRSKVIPIFEAPRYKDVYVQFKGKIIP